jgi:hypothetical protein
MKDYFKNESQNLRKLSVSDEKKFITSNNRPIFNLLYMKGMSKKSNGFVRK